MSSGKKRQLSGDSERVLTQDGGAHDTTNKTAGDKTLKAAKRSRRVTASTETGDTTSDKPGWSPRSLGARVSSFGQSENYVYVARPKV